MKPAAVADLIRTRRSTRRFSGKPVSDEILHRLIELGSWAPSAGNRQDWHFSVIASESMKKAMADAVRQKWQELCQGLESHALEEFRLYGENFTWFWKAPAVVVVSCRTPTTFLTEALGLESARRVAGAAASAAMAAQNIQLAAPSLGLGSCCLTGPLAAEAELKSLLGLGKQREIVCLMAVGFPEEGPSAPTRKPITEIARYWK